MKNGSGGVLNRYALSLTGSTLALDVEDFEGHEGLSELYKYTIRFTSADQDIHPQQVLRKSSTFSMRTLPDTLLGELQPPITLKMVHGTMTSFRRITASRDQVSYEVVLQPFLALLNRQYRTHRFFVNASVPEVVKQVLTEHGLKGWEYEFRLKKNYPKREQINQYQESDLAFIQRLLAELGIFYFFTLQPDTQTEVVHFGDTQAALVFGKKLAINTPSGMSDNGAESVWALSMAHTVVERNVFTKDYNHREAQNLLQSTLADMTHGEGNNIHYGAVYHYLARHTVRGDNIDPAPETANFWARLDHERFLAEQTIISGKSTDTTLFPAQVLFISNTHPTTLPAQLQEPVLLTHLMFTGSRKSALQVDLTGVPYSEILCWRPPLLPRPKVTGTMTARVTSAKEDDIYAWQDEAGLYRVKFDADLDDRNQGQESMPVRLAKPYSGDTYGFHFPLIAGTEVAIAFHEGDPDRPYIAHALHDSRSVDHVTESNSTRNVIRTAGLNKLRMEDMRGKQHIKLSTEYGGKTQLNLGHNVNASRDLRGEGAELRTDDWISVRGGKGILLTADAQPDMGSKMLEMDAAIEQLTQALALARSLRVAAKGARATPSDIDGQKTLNNSLKYLKKAGLLAHAPAGVGILSPQAIRLASGSQSIGLMSGKNTDISAGESFTVSAASRVSLFAQGEGIQFFAGSGKVEIQAQGDELNLSSLKDMTFSSSESNVTLHAGKELILNCNGAYIKLSGGNIELGCRGNIFLKAENINKTGPASLDTPPLLFPKGYGEAFTTTSSQSGQIKPFTTYRIITAEGDVYEGISDSEGKTSPIFTAMPSQIKIEYPRAITISKEKGQE